MNETPDWIPQAKCRGKHSDIWFPPTDVPNSAQYYAVSRAVCERCPVWEPCLEFGMDEVWGMWGGLIPNERKAIKQGGPYVRNHGTTSRYRQGCRCVECTRAFNRPITSLDMSLIPPNTCKDMVISSVKETVIRAVS